MNRAEGMADLDVDEEQQAGDDHDSSLGDDQYTYGPLPFLRSGHKLVLISFQDHDFPRIIREGLSA